jgi:hypothetical protein
MLIIGLGGDPMRWRRMFYLTGLPGWLRFGFSPGWGALPPGAAYLFGRYPGPWAWGAFPPGAAYPFPGGYPGPWTGFWTKEAEIEWLSAQAEALEEELRAIKERLDELTKEKG